MSLHADLTSLLSTLDQVLDRIDELSGSVDADQDDPLLGDLYEVERHLRQATRRLNRTVTSMPEHSA